MKPAATHAIAVSLALVCAAGVARAQGTPAPATGGTPAPAADTAPPDAAREAFDAGVRLLEDARYADAAEAFERSLAVRESAVVRYNLVLAYRGAGHYRRAISVLETLLAGDAAASHPELQQGAHELLAQMQRDMPHVTVRVRGGADSVLVDGIQVGHSDGALRLELDPGQHGFEARRAGYAPATTEVAVAPAGEAEVALDASARPLPAVLRIETGDARAVVRLDRQLVGPGETGQSLGAGRHRIDVVFPGRPVQHREVDLAPGSRVTMAIRPEVQRLIDRWWFWSGVGVLAAGAGVAIGVAALSHTEQPVDGTWGTTQAIQQRP